MTSRRTFITMATAGLGGAVLPGNSGWARGFQEGGELPAVVSTWNFGMAANEAAWKILGSGGYALDLSLIHI